MGHFILNGAADKNRTRNPQIRSLVLYPVELRPRANIIYNYNPNNSSNYRHLFSFFLESIIDVKNSLLQRVCSMSNYIQSNFGSLVTSSSYQHEKTFDNTLEKYDYLLVIDFI